MILRTPPRKRKVDPELLSGSPVSDRRLVIYEDPLPESPQRQSDHLLCTYQCRQMVKSEFIDALGTAEKEVTDLQSRLELLRDNLCKTEAEKKKFQDQFLFVEQVLAAAKGRERALQEQLMKEVKDSHERHQRQVKHCSELEVKLKKEVDLRRNAESSVAATEEKALLLEEKLRTLTESTEREKRHLHNEFLYLQNDSKFSVSRMGADLELVQCRANNAENESELLKKQLEDLQEKLMECLRQKNEVEQKLSNFNSHSEDGKSKETLMLVKQLQEELRNCESEVQEARRLKASHVNTELLKEKLKEERRRRERAEAELSKVQEVQLNAKKLEDELMSWEMMIKEIPGVSCRDDIPKKFAVLQKEVVESMIKAGEVGARLKELEVALDVADLDKKRAETQLALAKEKADGAMLEVKRLALAVSSITQERDRLRTMISTYDEEAIQQKKQMSGDVVTDRTKEILVKELEYSLAEKEGTIREFEQKLYEQREVINAQHGELELLNEKLNNEARRIKSLEREGDRFRSEISLLESKLGHGDYSAASTKVLRMMNTLGVDNEAKHTIEALRSELQKTQAKLKAIEDLKGQSDAGNLVDSHISEKLAQLKGQIATLEKREERYKTVFAEKISVFRRACCSLFGYKIVMDDHQRPNGIPVTRFTLQSIYAQSDDEKLEFEYESGNTNIVVNNYSSLPDISQQVEIYIRKCNSIPAFTANLTVESFNRRTFA